MDTKCQEKACGDERDADHHLGCSSPSHPDAPVPRPVHVSSHGPNNISHITWSPWITVCSLLDLRLYGSMLAHCLAGGGGCYMSTMTKLISGLWLPCHCHPVARAVVTMPASTPLAPRHWPLLHSLALVTASTASKSWPIREQVSVRLPGCYRSVVS